jgi:hypothetical protein
MSEMDFKEILEKKLAGALNPVFPNSKYIEELQRKLTSKPDISVEYPNILLPVLLISGGLVTGVTLIVLLSKLFRTISGKSRTAV